MTRLRHGRGHHVQAREVQQHVKHLAEEEACLSALDHVPARTRAPPHVGSARPAESAPAAPRALRAAGEHAARSSQHARSTPCAGVSSGSMRALSPRTKVTRHWQGTRHCAYLVCTLHVLMAPAASLHSSPGAATRPQAFPTRFLRCWCCTSTCAPPAWSAGSRRRRQARRR